MTTIIDCQAKTTLIHGETHVQSVWLTPVCVLDQFTGQEKTIKYMCLIVSCVSFLLGYQVLLLLTCQVIL